MLVVETVGPTLMARIAVMQALNAGKPKHPKPPRQKAAKKYRVVS